MVARTRLASAQRVKKANGADSRPRRHAIHWKKDQPLRTSGGGATGGGGGTSQQVQRTPRRKSLDVRPRNSIGLKTLLTPVKVISSPEAASPRWTQRYDASIV